MGKLGKGGDDQELNAAKITMVDDGFVEIPMPENRKSHYPEGTSLMVKPATVKQIKHWNMQDWENTQAIQLSMRLVDDLLKTNAYLIIGSKKLDSKFLVVNDKLWVMKLIRDITFDSESVQPLNWICSACDERIDIEKLEDNNWECTIFPYKVNGDMSIDSGTSVKFYVPTATTSDQIFEYAMKQVRKQGSREDLVTKMLVEAEQASMLINPMSWNLSGTGEADKANKKIIDDAKVKFDELNLPDFKKFKEFYDYFKKQDYITGICPLCGEKVTIPSSQLDIRDLFRI